MTQGADQPRLLDDVLLLRSLVGLLPAGTGRGRTMTTTGWWWRALAPLASPATDAPGRHRRFAATLGAAGASLLLDGLSGIGQPGSSVEILELLPLQPAMARLARAEHLDRLQAEAVVAALQVGAGICVRTGNEGRLADVAHRYGIPFTAVTV